MDTQPLTAPPATSSPARLPWMVACGALLAALVYIGWTTLDRGQPRAELTAPAPAVPAATAAAVSSATPRPQDIQLTPKITGRECFGSAGCNVEFRVSLAYSGPALPDTSTWLITYEVNGVEDGPLINTLEMTGTQFEAEEESATLARKSDKISIKVTDVQAQ